MTHNWRENETVSMYVHPEFGSMCRVHPFNEGWMLSITPSMRSRLSLDVFFDNIFRTREEAKHTFEGLITVLNIKEHEDGHTPT